MAGVGFHHVLWLCLHWSEGSSGLGMCLAKGIHPAERCGQVGAGLSWVHSSWGYFCCSATLTWLSHLFSGLGSASVPLLRIFCTFSKQQRPISSAGPGLSDAKAQAVQRLHHFLSQLFSHMADLAFKCCPTLFKTAMVPMLGLNRLCVSQEKRFFLPPICSKSCISSSGPRPCMLTAGRELLVELAWLILALCHTPVAGLFVWRSKTEVLLQIESVEGKD